MDRLREAVSRMVDRPDRVAAEPGIPVKILTAAANAAVATAIKKALERGFQRAMSTPRTGPPPLRKAVVTRRRADGSLVGSTDG